ncbi:hypothetical protein AUP68_15791 [Ilyonectria robusta]
MTTSAKFKNSKYIQTQIFDSTFGLRPDGSLNANQHWCGRDDTTELFFRDWNHVDSCFSSEFPKTTIRPDGPLFADFETSVVLMAYEKPALIQTAAAQQRIKNGNNATDAGDATVAMYFISTVDDTRNGTKLEKTVTPLLAAALETHCQDDAWDDDKHALHRAAQFMWLTRVVCNVPLCMTFAKATLAEIMRCRQRGNDCIYPTPDCGLSHSEGERSPSTNANSGTRVTIVEPRQTMEDYPVLLNSHTGSSSEVPFQPA